MNKRKYPNSNRVNLEAKPRSYSTSKYTRDFNNKKYDNKEISKSDKFIIKTIISAVIIVGVFLINNMNTNFSKGITEEIDKAISYQVQWNTIFKSDIITNFEARVVSLLGGKDAEVFSDSSVKTFVEPVSGHLVSEFQEKTHPVFNTKIEPRGIEYLLFEDQSITAASDGVIINIMVSTYQGKRVVMQHYDQYKTVYDGVETCEVEEGQSVKKGEKIGFVEANEKISKLFFFEVWRDNAAVDPRIMFNVGEE
ncbi:peptidoglycan DD-metalloendopeptidase family protein [Alkalibaculum sp. M08DMB]|uniref:Peptidoglycan DD-metalloendopeptidase family protein n=1 Tax=Alkalibaculum sporogenes TaxID=2655001 RepID=A0A6A7KBN3_9FIRM|nr:M23 family metallopeptidase [Alkalibaculum sporogenes]MPW26597.1 peptidoglycan DD-metalloendopeptidase family protein [Alkalibaculum sporogenes]